MIVGVLFVIKVDAKPLVYQQCVQTHLDDFSEGELEASRELLNSLVVLQNHPEMQETIRKNYAFGVMLRKQNLDLALKISKELCTD
jgi:hypothetical protein